MVADFWLKTGIYAADALGIPSVLNIGIAIESLKSWGMFQLIYMENTVNCCGCLCIRKPAAYSLFDFSF